MHSGNLGHGNAGFLARLPLTVPTHVRVVWVHQATDLGPVTPVPGFEVFAGNSSRI